MTAKARREREGELIRTHTIAYNFCFLEGNKTLGVYPPLSTLNHSLATNMALKWYVNEHVLLISELAPFSRLAHHTHKPAHV
jgi:hypothetical protein